MPDTYRS